MQWKLDGKGAVYAQIMDHIRRGVMLGEFPPGEQVPAVRELAQEAKVNPNTMQRALYTLEYEGLLKSMGTVGRYVTNDPVILEQNRERILKNTLKETAEAFTVLGISLEEAAEMLKNYKEEA